MPSFIFQASQSYVKFLLYPGLLQTEAGAGLGPLCHTYLPSSTLSAPALQPAPPVQFCNLVVLQSPLQISSALGCQALFEARRLVRAGHTPLRQQPAIPGRH